MTETIAPERLESHNSVNVAIVSSSVHNYLNYNKKMQIRLAELNNNVSSVIKESCSGIDSICNRVRQCLCEMDNRHKTTYLMDEVTEYDIEDDKSKSCEEISQDVDETVEQTSTVDIIEEEKFDTAQNSEKVTSLTPFFTEINCNNEDPDNRESCRKQILNRSIYSLLDRDESMSLRSSESRISLDNFKETIITLCDNFEMMNKLVENINNEITKFSETAIHTETRSLEKIGGKELAKSKSGLKPIKRLSKSNSRQKSVQVGDCLSEIDIDLIELKKNSSSFIIPDVYRKRAFTDLYQKLIAQVEANDSLMVFRSLMNRQKKLESNKKPISQMKLNIPIMNYSVPKKSESNSSNQSQNPKKTDLSKKYADSLWFSQKNVVREGSRRNSRKASRKNGGSRKPNSRTVEHRSARGDRGGERKESKKKTSESLVQGKRLPNDTKHGSVGHIANRACSIECTCRMVVQNDMPPSPSTKCHLQWLRARPPRTAQRKLKFLDILDDLTYRDLLPLRSEYPRKDNHHRPRELHYNEIQDTYLYKLLYGKQGTKYAWKHLLETTIQSSKYSSLSRTPRSANLKRAKEERVNESFMERFCVQNYSRSDILKKLSPYIYDPEKKHENYGQSVIVMPVRAYYDHFKTNEPPTKQSNFGNGIRKVSGPPKDLKWFKRSELSTPRISKPMKVVYDTLPRNQETPSIITSNKSSAMPSKLLINSARSNAEKNQTNRVRSRSFSPKSFDLYCQNAKNGKTEFMDGARQENIGLHNKIQTDVEKIKRDIYGRKVSQMDRKLWAHKYGKSVGQKLISFVEHQKLEAEKPLPLYAIPKLQIVATPPGKRNSVSKVNPQKQVLHRVQNLKTKNEAIQNNLKKAINVIETRMMDILCDDTKSVEAFDIMEKEITNVLSLMKCKGKTNLKAISSKSCDGKDKVDTEFGKGATASLEEHYDVISEHLFERLERILDTGGSSMSNTSIQRSDEIKHQQQKVKEEVRKKQKLSSSKRTKICIVSPSSSASMDEKIISRRSPRTHSKKTEKIDVKPKLSVTVASIPEPINAGHWENTCGDQNSDKDVPIESEIYESLSDAKGTDEDKTQICEDQSCHNSSGDFIKQQDLVQKSDMSIDNDETNDTATDNKTISEDKVEKLITEEILPEDFSPEPNTGTFNSTVKADIEEFINAELNKVIDSIVSLSEEASVEQLPNEPAVSHFEKENLESSDYNTPPESSDIEKKMQMQVANKSNTSNYSEEVQKILKRVENIYSQLDDIQESESIDRIPVFKDADVSDVHSEIFLTPFMQAVKDARKSTRQTSKMTLIERSPSYYNVITFLDALTNIQKDAPYEVHTAQLHHYSRVYSQATVYHQSEIWYEVRYSSTTSLRTSCLRKSCEHVKNKKVSFFQMGKEDKTNQVTLCPFHKVKIVRISSQQFPPLEPDEEIYGKMYASDRGDRIVETKNGNKEKEDSDVSPKYSSLKNSCVLKALTGKSKHMCAIHGEAGTTKTHKREGGHEETKKSKLSVIDDKSTQVFCQMQTEAKQEEHSIATGVAEENARLTPNDDQSVDYPEYIEENPDDSKSTDKDFLDDSLLDPFYDYANESITPNAVMQNIEGIYEEDNVKYAPNPVQTQPKIVVFREVLEGPLPPPKNIKNVNDIELYKERLEKRKELRLMRKSSSEMARRKISTARSDNENVVLLKSFYAIVYILVFTALSMDYRCI